MGPFPDWIRTFSTQLHANMFWIFSSNMCYPEFPWKPYPSPVHLGNYKLLSLNSHCPSLNFISFFRIHFAGKFRDSYSSGALLDLCITTWKQFPLKYTDVIPSTFHSEKYTISNEIAMQKHTAAMLLTIKSLIFRCVSVSVSFFLTFQWLTLLCLQHSKDSGQNYSTFWTQSTSPSGQMQDLLP